MEKNEGGEKDKEREEEKRQRKIRRVIKSKRAKMGWKDTKIDSFSVSIGAYFVFW